MRGVEDPHMQGPLEAYGVRTHDTLVIWTREAQPPPVLDASGCLEEFHLCLARCQSHQLSCRRIKGLLIVR
jgi:hypothetical protein